MSHENQPFRTLKSPRTISRTDLPEELHTFYQTHEGSGLESSPDVPLRICKLDEAEKIGISDIDLLGGEILEGWEDFSAVQIGMSPFFDEIFVVDEAPSCPRGSVMVFGGDIIGPGGEGEHAFECSLVLAHSFSEWIKRIEEFDWNEPGLYPGEL
jgi:hypothetical protein